MPGVSEFRAMLYREHLEEISSLYDQRRYLLNSKSEATWRDVAWFENAIEPHLDALVVGDEAAVETCCRQAAEGDVGELFGAALLLCRQNRLDLFLPFAQQTAPKGNEEDDALVEALAVEAPPDWIDEIWRVSRAGKSRFALLLAKIAGRRRLPGYALEQLLQSADDACAGAIAWALGRTSSTEESRRALVALVRNHSNPEVRSVAAIALLRRGERLLLPDFLEYASAENWPLMAISLAGGRGVAPILLNSASARPSGEALLALAVLGDAAAIEICITALLNPALVDSAVLALNLITGAELYEETTDQDEAEDDHVDPGPEGNGNLRGPGAVVSRRCGNVDVWRKWWAGNKSRFTPGVRYRKGEPHSPQVLIATIDSPVTSRRLRQLASDELVIRYAIDNAFESEMPVADQELALVKLRESDDLGLTLFQPGRWYFNARVLE
jgi:uncharacterized protein (TIGR02270 family)